MQIFRLIVMFILGSIVGSFLNVCIYRLPREKSPWKPTRSYCPHCHERIAWYDNVPLVSYFLLRAQCRQCGFPISSRYVLVEFLTAAMFAATFGVLSSRSEGAGVIAVYLGLMALLIMASSTDIELRIIPNSLTIGAILLAPLFSVLVPELHYESRFGRTYLFTQDVVAGPVAACIVGMVAGAATTWGAGVMGKLLFKKEAMGLGDVKFMAALGGFLGWRLILLIFFLAPVFGAVAGIIHLLRTREHHIPYGPFISIASAVVMLWADRILAFIGLTPLLS